MEDFSWPWVGFKPQKKIHETLGGTYLLTHAKTKKFYIGSTRNIYGRLQKHIFELRKGIHGNKFVQEAFDDDPVFEVTFHLLGDREDETDLADHCFAAEQKLLDLHAGTGLCMNIATDARSALKGKKFTDEHRARISESLTGREIPTELRDKLKAAWNEGDIRQKASERMMGGVRSEETRRKISETRKLRYGKPPTEPKIPIDKRTHFSIDGVTYLGVREVAKSLGICRTTIRYRLKSDNFPTYKKLEA